MCHSMEGSCVTFCRGLLPAPAGLRNVLESCTLAVASCARCFLTLLPVGLQVGFLEGQVNMPPRFSGKVSSIIGDLSDAMSMLKDLLPPTNSELDMVQPFPHISLLYVLLRIDIQSSQLWMWET